MPFRAARRSLALPLAALLALAVPGSAAPSSHPTTAAFTASDAPDLWTAAGGGNTATIALGGTVTFHAATSEAHDAVFTSSSVDCQSGGVASGRQVPSSPGATWDGSCTFSAPGYHAFVCSLHTGMGGEVAVAGADGALPPRAGASTPAPSGGGSTTAGAALAQPLTPVALTPLAPQLVLERAQRGAIVRGTVAAAGPGASATIDVVARRRDLADRGGPARGVSRLRRIRAVSDGTGAIAFSIALGRPARLAVARRGRLSLLVRATVSGPRIAAGRATTQQRITLLAAARSPARAVVQVRNDFFAPRNVTIRRGGTVTWTWRSDRRPHDVVVERGGHSPIQRSGKYRRRFAKTGVYPYVCSLHDGMAGIVRVTSR